jgi:hypothetical protein
MPTGQGLRDSEMKKGLWAALFFCATACVASLYLGQDSNIDLKNYHIYNAWALWTGRWSQDFFAAGPWTFFSPLLDIPYYLVARALLPSHGAYLVALAGLPYGALLYVVYLISRRIADSLDIESRDRGAFIIACVLLAGTGAATWSVVGRTNNDITIAAIVLAAFYQVLAGLADPGKEPSPRRVAAAGLLLGLAVGLKLTAATYLPSMAVVIFSVGRGWRNKIRGLVIYGCCAFAVFAVVYGPWGWKLYELTGNPFFPFFNGVFRSDWMTSVNFRDKRLLPKSWLQWLFYPFYWTTLQSSVTQMPFRDIRLAMAYVFLAGYAAFALAREDISAKLFRGKYRSTEILLLFLVLSYVLWMYEFSVLRYLVAEECLAGIFIVVAIMAAARRLGRRAAWLPAVSVMSIAAVIIGYGVSPQWGRVPAGTDIFAVQAPPFEPGALLIFAGNPLSFLAPGLAATGRDLRFMSIPRGFTSVGPLAPDGFRHELGRRMKAKIAENARSLYVLFDKSQAPRESDLAAFGIEMDVASCRPGSSALGTEFRACRGIYTKARPANSR